MDRILVYSQHEDRSERAVQLGAELARRAGSRVTLVRVLEERANWGLEALQDDRGRQIRDLLVESETRDLESLAEPLRASGLEVEVRVSWGVPWEVLIDTVVSTRCDLVVKPAYGLNQEGRVFFGSTALNLFRRCPCPVWVVGDDGRMPPRILAAIDPIGGASRRAIATRIVHRAHEVGDWAHAAVHVASAWHAPAVEILEGQLSSSELKSYRQDAFDRSRQALDLILDESGLAFPDDRIHLLEGLARVALPRFAEESGFDLIVLGTLGRTGAVGDFLGETAEMISREVRSSVLAVPPEARAAS